MTGRRIAALAVAACLAVALAPSGAHADGSADSDPLRSLGGDSPLCKTAQTQQARVNCNQAGTVESGYPLDRYRFDWHIDTGVTHIEGNISATLQWMVSLLWQAVLWAAKGILLVFQWAFSLDLLGAALAPVRAALNRLHTTVFGQPWFLAAMSLLGLWGLFNGVMRRRHVQTVGSLLVSLLMMAAALALIARPSDTLGAATRAVNDTKVGILAGASGGRVSDGEQTLEQTSEQIFQTIVLRPWCAVEFGDVKWCLSKAPGDTVTRADRYLRWSVGSKERDAEYDALEDPDYQPGKSKVLFCDFCSKDDQALKEQFEGGYLDTVTDADRSKVKMQQQGRTLFRTGLVFLVLIGVAGWVILIGWLAIQSLFQALMGLVLLLCAPIMLFAPAFGDRGRQTFMAWASRLLATVVSGAVYALLLAIVITVAQLVGELNFSATWLAAWVLQFVFLWGVFFKRKDVLSWLSGNTIKEARNSTRFSELQAKRTTIQQAASPALAIAGAPAALIGAAGGAAFAARRDKRADTDRAVQTLAADELNARGRQRLQTQYDAYHARLSTHDEAARKLPEMRRRRDALDRDLKNPKLDENGRKDLQAKRGKLTGQIKALEPKLLPRADEGVARKFIESSDRNLVENGERFSDQQVQLAVEGLRASLAAGAGPGDQANAWRLQAYHPGVPEAELAKLPDDERADLHRRVDEDIDRDRALFAALPTNPRQERPTRSGRRSAQRQLHREGAKPAVVAARHEVRAARLADAEDTGPLHSIRAKHADRSARRARQKLTPPAAAQVRPQPAEERTPAPPAARPQRPRGANTPPPPPPPAEVQPPRANKPSARGNRRADQPPPDPPPRRRREPPDLPPPPSAL